MATSETETRSRPSRDEAYSYDHVRSKTLMHDMGFTRDAPRPGDRLPDFDLPTTDGGRISSAEVLQEQPMLLVTGSMTCPMTASSNPMLKRLHAEFGDKIRFVLLHVREAHPGEHRDQPHSPEEKMDHARRLKQRDELPFAVAVDGPEGDVHRRLDGKPNSAWLADRDGTLVYRALWAGDEKGLRPALEAVSRGERPAKAESKRRLIPMAKGIGVMQESIREAGPRAQRDLIKAAPPMAAMAWVADRFRPLPPKWRGLAAIGTLGIGVTAAVAAAARTLRRGTRRP